MILGIGLTALADAGRTHCDLVDRRQHPRADLDGGRNRAQFDVAVARRNQAAFGYRSTVLTAFREVEDNLAAAHRLHEQVESLGRRRTALVSALGHARNNRATS